MSTHSGGRREAHFRAPATMIDTYDVTPRAQRTLHLILHAEAITMFVSARAETASESLQKAETAFSLHTSFRSTRAGSVLAETLLQNTNLINRFRLAERSRGVGLHLQGEDKAKG